MGLLGLDLGGEGFDGGKWCEWKLERFLVLVLVQGELRVGQWRRLLWQHVVWEHRHHQGGCGEPGGGGGVGWRRALRLKGGLGVEVGVGAGGVGVRGCR